MKSVHMIVAALSVALVFGAMSTPAEAFSDKAVMGQNLVSDGALPGVGSIPDKFKKRARSHIIKHAKNAPDRYKGYLPQTPPKDFEGFKEVFDNLPGDLQREVGAHVKDHIGSLPIKYRGGGDMLLPVEPMTKEPVRLY